MSCVQRAGFLEQCQAYDDELRQLGYLQGTACVPSDQNAITIRNNHGQPSVRNGPLTEGDEQLMRIVILEAFDLNHAIALLSKHPLLWDGVFELHPVELTTQDNSDLSPRLIGEPR
ncbi:MAG: hypothetical protein JWP89_3505 [Schlesneria sp.]|nr:hypothetical protein [Schlesneria sp.]